MNVNDPCQSDLQIHVVNMSDPIFVFAFGAISVHEVKKLGLNCRGILCGLESGHGTRK